MSDTKKKARSFGAFSKRKEEVDASIKLKRDVETSLSHFLEKLKTGHPGVTTELKQLRVLLEQFDNYWSEQKEEGEDNE